MHLVAGSMHMVAGGYTRGNAAGDAGDEQSRAAAQIAAGGGGGGEVPADYLAAAGNTSQYVGVAASSTWDCIAASHI